MAEDGATVPTAVQDLDLTEHQSSEHEQHITNIDSANPDAANVLAEREGILHIIQNEPTLDASHDQIDIAYRPTAEEIEAAEMFDEVNNEDVAFRELTEQEQADAELALILQAQLEDGYNSDNDRDMAPEVHECVCGDAFTWQQMFNMVTLNCGCIRCDDCLNLNVAFGLESKRNYPPRCCNVGIEVELVQNYLSDDNIIRWVAVKDEYEDRAPVYCAVKACSVYLTKDSLDSDHKWAFCPICKVNTCSGCLCLESEHVEADKCPERIEKMDRELMTEKRWKPCPGCRHMIERTEGCDHMSCDCGTEFCYECGRGYTGGMPCNCHGQRDWVEENAEANNPVMQQQILDNLGHQPDQDDEHDIDDQDDDSDEEEEGSDEGNEVRDLQDGVEEHEEIHAQGEQVQQDENMAVIEVITTQQGIIDGWGFERLAPVDPADAVGEHH